MVKTEFFWIKKDPEAPTITNAKNFDRKNYPYLINEEIFSKLDDAVAYYRGRITECDILFEPTFLIHDRLRDFFGFLEPDLDFKGVQLYKNEKPKENPYPMYWLPFLPAENIFSEKMQLIRGVPEKIILDEKKIPDRRILHGQTVAADIWILNLEAAECLLRRQPIGIILEKISVA